MKTVNFFPIIQKAEVYNNVYLKNVNNNNKCLTLSGLLDLMSVRSIRIFPVTFVFQFRFF